jgi:S1-C subfamily serine protease
VAYKKLSSKNSKVVVNVDREYGTHSVKADGIETSGLNMSFSIEGESVKRRKKQLNDDAITEEKRSKPSASTGAGFFINNQGHIVTNSHVVKDCRQINTLHQG